LAKHRYFEELCALAPLGELGSSQLRELHAHLSECDECRRAAMEYGHIYQEVVPAMNRPEEAFIADRRNDIRSSVLSSIARIEPRPATVKMETLPSLSTPGFPWLRHTLWAGLAASVLAVTAFWIGARSFQEFRPQAQSQVTPASVAKATPAVVDSAARNSARETEELEHKQWMAALAAENSQNAELAKKVSAEEKQLEQAVAARDALRAQLETQTSALDATQAELDDKKAQLEQVQAATAASTATLASLQYQVQQLTRKLDTQTASLDRERGLLSHGREIRDIIGARNLHIIDVYDTDTHGGTIRPFARAFYTEHKSLVYYAYDLPQRSSADGKYAYVAWGESNVNKNSIKKIGILFNDNQNRNRWSLSFIDPEVLADINSVFITLERTDKDVEQPKGKRMLTAYLGAAPNHP
jgi:hypothetical protein